jgi:hypothetical protein
MKYLAILSLAILCTSCAWLAQHPQVEADLQQEGIDVAKDTEKVVEDVILPPSPTTPAAK